MRRLVVACVLLVLSLMPGGAAPAGFQMLDWLPGDDASLHRQITEVFRLDADKMPYLQQTPDGFALVNPGGSPAAIAWTPFSADGTHARAYTVRFEARSDGPTRRASATLLTERLDFEAGGEWREQGVTGWGSCHSSTRLSLRSPTK